MLKSYNQKRNFKKTDEPKGKSVRNSKNIFVVQHHKASHDHYDFRYHKNGVLVSFALPKGPSYSSKVKRLAIKVEDHPYGYRNFEGVIPSGNYGAGVVMLWDTGTFQIIEESEHTLKFQLFGKRLKGIWNLIHVKENNYLFIKEKDEYENFLDLKDYQTSIKSYRTFKQIKEGIIISLTHPQKLFLDTTKESIYKYYQKVMPRMFPFLENRFISTIRYPSNTPFYKKHFEITHQGLGQSLTYAYVKDISGILDEIHYDGLEFHLWGALKTSMNYPNIMVFDLDPDKNLSLSKLREGVIILKEVLETLQFIPYLKVSGGKGYHILIPLNKKYTWSKVKKLSFDIARYLEYKNPNLFTTNNRIEEREGKIFIDYLRNQKGATFVAPYSLRIRKKITVSMPISWKELKLVKPDGISIKNALHRMTKSNPWQDFFEKIRQ